MMEKLSTRCLSELKLELAICPIPDLLFTQWALKTVQQVYVYKFSSYITSVHRALHRQYKEQINKEELGIPRAADMV